jgi:hypothetical protein
MEGTPPAQWLAMKELVKDDGETVFEDGISRFCPKHSKILKSAVEVTYPRWFQNPMAPSSSERASAPRAWQTPGIAWAASVALLAFLVASIVAGVRDAHVPASEQVQEVCLDGTDTCEQDTSGDTYRIEEVDLAAEQRRHYEERRTAYIAMNRACRQFHTLLKDALHRLRDGVYTDHERAQLEQARLDYRDRYAEAQLVVPDRVLGASRDLNTVLAAADAIVKRLDRGLARPGESADGALTDLAAAEPRLTTLRSVMREDLGIPE